MAHRVSWLVALTAILHVSCAMAASPEDAFNLAAFRALPSEQKPDFVLAMLDARDSELQNMECKVSEAHVNVAKSSGTRHAMNGYAYELRRNGSTLWMHVRMLRPSASDGEVRQDSIQNWNGQVGRRLGFPPSNGRTNPDGQIQSEESQCFSFQRYSVLLGFRVRLVQRNIPVTQWLRESRGNPAVKIEVSDAVREGATALKVRVDELGFRRELWLDPSRGFMTVQYDQVYRNHVMDTLLSVTDVENIDGIWLPKRAVGHNTTDYDSEFTEVTHELREFHLGSMRPSDVDVPFPVGTSVIDATRNVAYTILPDERYKLSPFANPAARLVYKGPENRVVNRIDDSVSKMYVAVPLSTTDVRATSARSYILRRWILFSQAFLVIAVVSYLWYRRRQRASKSGERNGLPAGPANDVI
jgi:hypothetical protein